MTKIILTVMYACGEELTKDRESQGMSHCYKRIKHPHTGQFEKATWLDMGKFWYVVFSDGHWYHEKYCLWEFQEENTPAPTEKPLLDKTA